MLKFIFQIRKKLHVFWFISFKLVEITCFTWDLLLFARYFKPRNIESKFKKFPLRAAVLLS